MALIVEYHVVADMYPMGTNAITAGMLVNLNAAGDCQAMPIGGQGQDVLGIAGDTFRAAQGQTTAYSDAVVIQAGGTTRWTENRVSDFYDETAASDKMTVYHGGGKFWISCDLFDDSGTAVAIGSNLMRSAATAGEWVTGAADDDIVGLAVGVCQAYPSGVPGTDVQSSITLGDYVPIVLRI